MQLLLPSALDYLHYSYPTAIIFPFWSPFATFGAFGTGARRVAQSRSLHTLESSSKKKNTIAAMYHKPVGEYKFAPSTDHTRSDVSSSLLVDAKKRSDKVRGPDKIPGQSRPRLASTQIASATAPLLASAMPRPRRVTALFLHFVGIQEAESHHQENNMDALSPARSPVDLHQNPRANTELERQHPTCVESHPPPPPPPPLRTTVANHGLLRRTPRIPCPERCGENGDFTAVGGGHAPGYRARLLSARVWATTYGTILQSAPRCRFSFYPFRHGLYCEVHVSRKQRHLHRVKMTHTHTHPAHPDEHTTARLY